MYDIADSFKNENEDYITIPVLREFIKENSICKISQGRPELMNEVISFANQSEHNAELVSSWVDLVIKAGIKDIYVARHCLSEATGALFNGDGLEPYLNTLLMPATSHHITGNKYNADLSFVKYENQATISGNKLVMFFCRKLWVYDKYSHVAKGIDYPIVCELYYETGWICISSKPKSNIYNYSDDPFILETASSTTIEKQIFEVVRWVEDKFEFEQTDKRIEIESLKNRLFNLLRQYAYTPAVIKETIDKKSDSINSIDDQIMAACNLPVTSQNDVDEDVRNTIEKYLSINWPDKDVFIRDRDAYPIKLSATDEEESKIEQTAAETSPLQSRAVFFDNKKMLYKSEKCDGVSFQWKRINHSWYWSKDFHVKITINMKAYALFKFTDFTAEEDINNVIFSIIKD
jgi:hypothetical protein